MVDLTGAGSQATLGALLVLGAAQVAIGILADRAADRQALAAPRTQPTEPTETVAAIATP